MFRTMQHPYHVSLHPTSIKTRIIEETLTFALILKSVGRIYGLDLGKDHKNPDGDRIGKKHKHSWSVEFRDKKAYVPTDITASIFEPVTLWEQFCEEACIEHNGKLNQIPPRQEELFR